ncbi:MAG: ABC transporter substrate-binding protein [Candidatus Thorarchaeota archaeon]|nr:MAG: ABC transporter substrate-binding protein [Candidatus Thorarchaeota archaeon]
MYRMRVFTISFSALLIVSMFLPCFMYTPAVAQDTDPIKIGIFAPFTTASLSFYAPWTKQGFELGMIYATTEMGYDNENKTQAGRDYEFHYYDTKGDVTEAASLATTAIETDGIDILVGATYSSVAAALVPIAETYEKLFFITPAADASLTGSLLNQYVFRIARNNWHDAYAGVTYAMDTLGHTNFAFLAADYSFGYSGVESMKAVIEEKGGTVVIEEYAALGTTDFSPELTNILAADASTGIDYLFVIWAGSFAEMYADFGTYNIADSMEIAGACIDILSMNIIEAGMTPPATYVGATGLCLYGYQLPDNDVNDWMVEQHVARNVRPNGAFGLQYRVPELFTASAFATAQFLVDVTNAVPSLDSMSMITYLESGITINAPKGSTYLRPADHQGLAEMYIAEAWRDNESGSETEGFIIAKLVETLDRNSVAPPIDTNYTPIQPAFDLVTISVVVGVVLVVVIIAVVWFRKR